MKINKAKLISFLISAEANAGAVARSRGRKVRAPQDQGAG